MTGQDVLAGAPSARRARRPVIAGRGLGYVLCVAPLVLFLGLTFIWPVARFLFQGVDNAGMVENLPRTAGALAGWNRGEGLPGDEVFAALVRDLADAKARGTDGVVAQLVNQRVVGTRYLVLKTASLAAKGELPPGGTQEAVLERFPDWGNLEIWSAIAADSGRFTNFYLLSSLDLQRSAGGTIEPVPPDSAIFVQVLLRTIWISFVVTLICVLLALPVAHAMVAARPGMRRVLVALILFPLWTSLLVRTVVWIILLQGNGPINGTLEFLGIIDEPLDLIYTRLSLYIAMVQVLLPMMILSIMAVMRRTPQDYMRAALSLGAPWTTAWRRVQLPMIMPGILAGSGIVFVFSLGYYITPILIGGPKEQMISSFIAFYTNSTLNWGLAAALSIQLLLLLALAWVAFVMGRVALARGARS